MISLLNNEGFRWYNDSEISVKGYGFFKNKYYANEDLLKLFQNISEYCTFVNVISEINGHFSVVINKENYNWIAVDRERSFPIFFSENGEYISDSAEVIREKLQIEKKNVDPISVSEMILSSYVNGNNTAYCRIKQLQLGQAAIICNSKVGITYYYKHVHSVGGIKDRESLLKQLDLVSDNMFDRLIHSLSGRTVVIPLSGGYDSRYVAAMLKRKNYNNVICYTYGNKDEYEVKYSKKVAETLGFKWYCIEYTADMWKSIFTSEFFQYCTYNHNHCSIPHIQDYLALRELKNQNIISKDCVIVNGFCGDLPAGSCVLPHEDKEQIKYTHKWLCDYIYNEHYVHFKSTKYQEKKIKVRIEQYLNEMDLSINNFNEFTSMYEAWFTASRPSKWVINSNRLYEFFEMEWRMPLWDNEFVQFWYSLDTEFRTKCNLYKEWLFGRLFEPMKIDMKKPSYIRPLSIKYKRSFKKKVKMCILNILTYLEVKTCTQLLKKNDVNNYTIFALTLYKRISNKQLFDFKRIYAHQMMALWWCENEYGNDVIKKIFEIRSDKNE